MNKIIIILIFLISIPVFGQDLPRKEGAVKIKMIYHSIFRNENDNLIVKISNMANRPYKRLYLDTLGNLIEEVRYGHYHNRDLRVVSYVTIHKYEKSKIIESIEYETNYGNKNLSPDYRTEYFYDDKEQLIKEVILYYDSDSIFMQWDYTYDSIGNKIKIDFNDNTYYIRTFDDKNKILSLQQFYKNNLNWEYVYTYTKTSRVGDFKSYYDNGKVETKQEIILYQNENIKQREEIRPNIMGDSFFKMTKYYYNKSGLITKIKNYENYNIDVKEKYKLRYYINIKTKAKCKVKKQLVKQINEIILDATF